MNTIPEEFQINTLLNQDTYLVDGELKKWTVKPQQFFSTISSTAEYAPTILGSVPLMGEAEAAEVVLSASTAFNNGQGLWPTMKVTDRIKCVEDFVKQMKATRQDVVKLLMK
jgi:glyceraldehyde-3-phosphate dehydrogenase (NADP+)